MPLSVLQNLFCKLMNCLSTKLYSILPQQQTTDLFKVKNYLTLKSRSEKALTLVRDRNNNRPTKATHFMKCSRRSVTNLAALTIGLPGSLNVRVLCSMYRTSHINEERRLHPNSWQKRKKKEGQFLAVYMNGGKKWHPSSHSPLFSMTSENVHIGYAALSEQLQAASSGFPFTCYILW